MPENNTNTFAPLTHALPPYSLPLLEPGAKIAVVGAGVFGGWTALSLLRMNFQVTLIDAWGAGNSRSSSGDETRVIRSTYGNNEVYFDLNVRSLNLWKAFEKQCGHKIFFNQGVVWLCHEEKTPMVDDSIPFAQKHQMEYEYLNRSDIEKKYQVINASDLHHAYLDPFGGFLKARESCLHVRNQFISEGGSYRQSYASPGLIRNGRLESLQLSDNAIIKADNYIFACGSWLGKLFPDVLGQLITCSKQEVYYFGVPFNSASLFDQLPVWVDVDGVDFYYGIPTNNGRGFKIGVDRRGESFDPGDDERIINKDVLEHAQKFIAHRFPVLHNAPLLENRVCPYENSPDGNFIIDLHPGAENVVLVGGGSGHGFKHGPAVGELVTQGLIQRGSLPGLFSLSRFNSSFI